MKEVIFPDLTLEDMLSPIQHSSNCDPAYAKELICYNENCELFEQIIPYHFCDVIRAPTHCRECHSKLFLPLYM